MRKKTIIIIVSVVCTAVVAAGLGVLIWWLVTRDQLPYTVIELEGDGIGTLTYRAAFTRLHDIGDVFWWFYPTTLAAPLTRPLVVWLDGTTGVPPSLLANIGMIGPYDVNFERRNGSWVEQCNLLFIDAPIGVGYSTPSDTSQIPMNIDENVEHLLLVLESFYSIHEEYKDTPLYIFGQADGAKSAVLLAIKLNELQETEDKFANIQGVALGNGIISPALAMTKLGFYLEELGYIDDNGRTAIETLSQNTNNLVISGNLETAFNNFISLGDFINENAGAVAVNLGYIVEKLTRGSSNSRDYFGQRNYIRSILGSDGIDLMNNVVAPALGIDSSVTYDEHRDAVLEAVKGSFMTPFTDKIEYILSNTDLSVSIYNGNLDAVSNTPGQLEWVDNLQWSGQTNFRNTNRTTLVVNRLVEGYFRATNRLRFYWINAAGQSAPLDNAVAMNRILPMITAPVT